MAFAHAWVQRSHPSVLHVAAHALQGVQQQRRGRPVGVCAPFCGAVFGAGKDNWAWNLAVLM